MALTFVFSACGAPAPEAAPAAFTLGSESIQDGSVVLPVVSGTADAVRRQALTALLSPENLYGISREDILAQKQPDSDLIQGLTAGSWTVELSTPSLLWLRVDTEWMGAYPSGFTSSLIVDLDALRVLKAADILRPELIEDLLGKLAADRDERIKDALAHNPDELEGVLTPGPLNADQLSTILPLASGDGLGLRLIIDYGMPHALLALEPDAVFDLSPADSGRYLKPEFLKAAGR